MAIARVFKSGNSQAVRLPKEFRLAATEVEIFRRGEELVLRETPRALDAAFALIADLPADVLPSNPAGRDDAPPQRRKGL